MRWKKAYFRFDACNPDATQIVWCKFATEKPRQDKFTRHKSQTIDHRIVSLGRRIVIVLLEPRGEVMFLALKVVEGLNVLIVLLDLFNISFIGKDLCYNKGVINK